MKDSYVLFFSSFLKVDFLDLRRNSSRFLEGGCNERTCRETEFALLTQIFMFFVTE